LGGRVPTTFTIAVPASFSVVNGLVLNEAGPSLNVMIPPGQLVLTFNYFPLGMENARDTSFLAGSTL
jgi:hypothetical protein